LSGSGNKKAAYVRRLFILPEVYTPSESLAYLRGTSRCYRDAENSSACGGLFAYFQRLFPPTAVMLSGTEWGPEKTKSTGFLKGHITQPSSGVKSRKTTRPSTPQGVRHSEASVFCEQHRVSGFAGQVIGCPFFGSFLWANKEMNNTIRL